VRDLWGGLGLCFSNGVQGVLRQSMTAAPERMHGWVQAPHACMQGRGPVGKQQGQTRRSGESVACHTQSEEREIAELHAVNKWCVSAYMLRTIVHR